MDENPDDMHSLMQSTNTGGNEDIKIKVKDYNVENDDSVEPAEKFYESDDEEKNYTKTNMNNSREDQLKLIPSFGASVIEMGKMRESCLSGQSDFKTNREMGYQELEEKYNHYRKTAHQYEKLYGQYLEKFIVAEKERVILDHQTRRAAYLIQKTAYAQAKWDASSIDERKKAFKGCGIVGGICCLIIFISMLTA